ncbi:NADH-quinone oxidoreductase subunit NuoN [Sphingomonas astaxanthinifaciens]|uniref:NADH-quinone oxidoreductase subunit N n=1 Tax=Sphingomonas astaxanthinifaciens DSM 22298 TaxID=1123267 RepID=A0ABQ5ZAQ3_9SPHN|nr:NADH-quinone oxidoreductase subunit NuoN [Sphingomonas astaxanthinifaciens]GLR48566.1 NADH-quinone oxidoreductase subunit N [Sphingomonas astaxanthinifaciens DSM 22298]
MNAAPILPEILLGLGAIVLMMVSAFVRRASSVTHWGAILVLLGACAALIGAPQTAGAVFDGMWAADSFAAFGKVIIYLSAAVAIVMAHNWFERDQEHAAEYAVLILLSALGASMMVSATDLMMLYVGLELQSLSAYVLASYRRHDERSAEAGLKYFVLGGLASGILLYGISLIYGFAGTTLFTGIAAAFADGGATNLGLLFGLVFTLAGLAFKISAVPFHMWTPDVYEGAPTPVAAFFAAGQKAAAILLATRVCLDAMGPATSQWQQIVIFAALGSIILGAVAAYGQTNIKRLLAYSSINNVGFALVGLAAGGRAGAQAVLLYVAVYVVMTLGAFLCVLRMRDAEGRPVESLASLSGLSQTRPALALALAMFMFSLAGIPPLFGFWPKLMVFQAAVGAGLNLLALAAAALTVVGAYYYLKVIKVMYFDAPAEAYAPARSGLESALIAVTALVISPVGYLLIRPLSDLAANAASVF